MKNIIWALIVACLATACQSQPAKENQPAKEKIATADAPKVKFEKPIYDFGTIIMGQKVIYEFKFKNVGKSPLVIKNAMATCGCTVPDYPVEPILPNKTGTIKVIFDSQGKFGKQDKVITLKSNAQPEMETLHVVGEVLNKK